MDEIDITIIGAGVVGLAVAGKLAKHDRSLFVIERHDSFGRETSSRNSEVIHAGIYYPENTLKAKACVEGRHMLYELCESAGIACKKTGKLIVAVENGEIKELERLLEQGRKNRVEDLRLLSQKEIKELEPNIRALSAVYSPQSGIIDSHNLMKHFAGRAKKNKAELVFNSEVTGIERKSRGYKVIVRDAGGEDFSFLTRILINCAGLNSDKIAEKAGMDIDKAGYRIHFCKGEYFRVQGDKCGLINRLIYPLPPADGVSLGLHATPDLSGGLRLGPDAEYIDRDSEDLSVDISKQGYFSRSAKRFLPFIEHGELTPDTAGIRPKLQGPGEDVRDFVIRHEAERGFSGFINLIGIDSPGLTAAPAIAGYVRDMVEGLV